MEIAKVDRWHGFVFGKKGKDFYPKIDPNAPPMGTYAERNGIPDAGDEEDFRAWLNAPRNVVAAFVIDCGTMTK